MKILFVSYDASGCGLAWRLQEEGNDVKVYVHKKSERQHYDGILKRKVSDWKKELDWVGKKGLIVFDYAEFGKTQDKLRKAGYNVVGGCHIGDLLENNRKFGQRVFSQLGMETVPSRTFYDIDTAIDFVRRNPGYWVVKQNGHLEKDLNYVGELESGEDVISVLELYKKVIPEKRINFDLQKKVSGVEIGVGRYFNGNDWVGPIEFNVEHKSLFAGGFGPKTFEMGTIMWYSDDFKNKLYVNSLEKMKSFLVKIGFKGDFEMNFIVNENHIYPLEATARFGYPALQLQSEFHLSPWGEFLMALAKGEKYDLEWKRGEGIVYLVATPPFPYEAEKNKRNSSYDFPIIIDEKTFKEKRKSIHLEDVYLSADNRLCISSDQGYVLHVSSVKDTLFEARQDVIDTIDKITIPKMFYRNDVGYKFLADEKPKLKKWGYMK